MLSTSCRSETSYLPHLVSDAGGGASWDVRAFNIINRENFVGETPVNFISPGRSVLRLEGVESLHLFVKNY